MNPYSLLGEMATLMVHPKFAAINGLAKISCLKQKKKGIFKPLKNNKFLLLRCCYVHIRQLQLDICNMTSKPIQGRIYP